jgi:hypothetical protein
MSLSQTQSKQQQQSSSSSSKVVGIVWEGEWPAIKEIVRSTRKATQATYGFLHDALYFPSATTAVSNSLHTVDDRVHRSSLFVAKYLNQTSPWLPQASTVVMTSLLATIKSNHYWGGYVAARNGLVTAVAGSLFFFPDEIRDKIFHPNNGGEEAVAAAEVVDEVKK